MIRVRLWSNYLFEIGLDDTYVVHIDQSERGVAVSAGCYQVRRSAPLQLPTFGMQRLAGGSTFSKETDIDMVLQAIAVPYLLFDSSWSAGIPRFESQTEMTDFLEGCERCTSMSYAKVR